MLVIDKLPELYKRDSKGKLRIWEVEIGQDTDATAGIRTISGLIDGKKVTSKWKICKPKNVGKVNATTSVEQAEFEAKALWDKRSEKEYFVDISAVDSYEKFEPMLANDYAKLKEPLDFEHKKIYSQPKLDGIRCIATKTGLWTRTGKEIVAVPHIWEKLKEIFKDHPNLVLDGELYNHELKDDFNKIVSLVRKTKLNDQNLLDSERYVQYHVYDIFCNDNKDMEFCERQKLLKSGVFTSIFKAQTKKVQLVDTVFIIDDEHVNTLYDSYLDDGYEGQILRLNKPYEHKRSKNLMKRKEFITEEFKVVSIEEGQGNWSGHVKRFILETPEGKVFGAGVRGKQKQLKQLFEDKATPTWATLRYFGLSPDGIPRFPVVIDYGMDIRED